MAARIFTRREYHDLVWSMPLRNLAKEIGFSDVAVRKAAIRAGIVLPAQGHWNRVAAGRKPAPTPKLAPRGFGSTDNVRVGGHPWWHVQRDPSPDEPLPPPPTFEENMDEVRERAKAVIKKVVVLRDLENPHPAIRQIFDEEAARAKKAVENPYFASSNAPRFTSAADRRRLRIANAIALGLARADVMTSLSEAANVTLGVGSDAAHLTVTVAHLPKSSRGKGRTDGLSVTVTTNSWDGRKEYGKWSDTESATLESGITDMVVEIAVALEARCRDLRKMAHGELVARREAQLEAARQAALEAERRERERLAALERARVERLLADADRLRQADAIRAFVDEIGRRVAGNDVAERVRRWSEWALVQADRIDPTRDLAFLREAEDAVQAVGPDAVMAVANAPR